MKKIVLTAVAALIATWINTVFADPGMIIFDGWIEEEGVPIEDLFGGVDESPCGFPVYVDYQLYETMKAYFDDDGNLSEFRFWDKNGFFSYYTDLNDIVLDEKNSILFARLDVVNGTIEVRGNGQHLTLPKAGNIFRVTGHWVVDFLAEELLSASGKHDTWPDGDWTLFCDALLGY